MKLVHIDLESQFEFDEKINVLCVENAIQFRKFLEDFHCQIDDGLNGKFVLSENEKNLDFSKSVMVITDYFSLDFNEKKLQNKLYLVLQSVCEEKFKVDFAKFNEEFYRLFNKLNSESPFELECDIDPSINALLKCFGVSFSCENSSFIEKLCKYTEIIFNLLSLKLIVFVNLKSYLSKEELKLVYQFFSYNKINIFLLESNFKESNEQEFCVIVDNDLCEIVA